MRFLLLAVNFFYSGIQKDILIDPIQSRERVYPQREVFGVSLPLRQKWFLWGCTPPPLHAEVYPQKKVLVVSVPTRQRDISLRVHYWGYTIKTMFSSSRCRRDKEIFLWGLTTWGTPSKNVLVVSLPTRQRDISLRVNYFCRLILGGTKIIYNKSLPVNFVRMFKINTRKLWQIKINKQWVINTN